MKVAIVNYGAGNVRSVKNALDRLGVESTIMDDPEILRMSDKVIFPGVGEASTAMGFLQERNLDSVIKSLTQPVLGICLGMQLLCSSSEENNTTCLGLLPYRVRRFSDENGKVPHCGWNNIYGFSSPLFGGVEENSRVYFVHSYYVEKGAETTAESDYFQPFSAAVSVANFHAVQFHPEKSGPVGERILENFLNL